MKLNLSASMMCADFSNLQQEVFDLDQAGIDSFHIDIMDGSFVDNLGMGYQDMACIKKHTKIPLEVHLMVKKPYNYLNILFDLGIDTIYIHPEVDCDPATTIEKIQAHKCNAGIALNPGTSISSVEELLNVVDKILVLGVNPGHAGRQYQEYVDDKIENLLYLSDINVRSNYEICLDGAVTKNRILKWYNRGVSDFILGTATLFGKETNYSEILLDIKNSTRIIENKA